MKVHVGCGSIYLKGWLNVDIQGPDVHLARDREDLVELLSTTEEEYYARHEDKTIERLRGGPLDQQTVCDEYGTFDNLPGITWSIDEILARQVFEHLSIGEAHKALDEVDRKLKPGGILRIDVPDHEATLKKFRETQDDFYIRHLLGPRKNDYGYHMMSYTRERLINLVMEHGFIPIGEEENIHFYPAFCIRFRKPGFLPAWASYVPTDINPQWRVLEIGPGANPYPRANVYLDVSINHLNDVKKKMGANKTYVEHNIINKLPFEDKFFDYVFCAHVLEHVDNPEFAAKEISRIGKTGLIVVPSIVKDSIMLFEETDHKVWFLPGENPNELICMKFDKEWINKLRDIDSQKAMCRVMRCGPNRLDHDQRTLRKWFFTRESLLDIVIHWKGGFNVRNCRLDS